MATKAKGKVVEKKASTATVTTRKPQTPIVKPIATRGKKASGPMTISGRHYHHNPKPDVRHPGAVAAADTMVWQNKEVPASHMAPGSTELPAYYDPPTKGRGSTLRKMFANPINRQFVDELPHEFMLRIARGAPVRQRRYARSYNDDGTVKTEILLEEEIYPTFEDRFTAAQLCAPYFAPRLTAVAQIDTSAKGLMTMLNVEQLAKLTDADLNGLLKMLDKFSVLLEQKSVDDVTDVAPIEPVK